MGLFGFLEKRRKDAIAKEGIRLGSSAQMELCRCAKIILLKRYEDDKASKIAAIISNYVFWFGKLNQKERENNELMQLLETEKRAVFRDIDEIFKSNATGALILLAAAWQVDMDTFKAHLSRLAEEGFAKIGADTPDVSKNLMPEDSVYVFWATEIGL